MLFSCDAECDLIVIAPSLVPYIWDELPIDHNSIGRSNLKSLAYYSCFQKDIESVNIMHFIFVLGCTMKCICLSNTTLVLMPRTLQLERDLINY